MNTKEQILNTALDLFSTKGYSASSVRDIGKVIGIKESSLYYHYKNKQAIFDALTTQFIKKSEDFMNLFNSFQMQPTEMNNSLFYMVGTQYAEKYLLNDNISKFVRVMMIEQASNTEIRALYRKWLFDMPIEFQSIIFQIIIDNGFMHGSNGKDLAMAYYSPIFFFYNYYLMDMNENTREIFIRQINNHIEMFIKEYGGRL